VRVRRRVEGPRAGRQFGRRRARNPACHASRLRLKAKQLRNHAHSLLASPLTWILKHPDNRAG
jgi:hypothetical protein